MKPFFFYPIACLGLALAGCSAERVASGPSQPREQEVLRLRAAPNKAPVVFGQVQIWDETGRYPLPKALVSIDGKASYTNETGAYHIVLAPGTHQLLTAKPGMRQARFTLKVERGDSVRVNFYLRPD